MISGYQFVCKQAKKSYERDTVQRHELQQQILSLRLIHLLYRPATTFQPCLFSAQTKTSELQTEKEYDQTYHCDLTQNQYK